MTTPISDVSTEELCRRVLELHEKATPGPWTCAPETNGIEFVAYSIPWSIRELVFRVAEWGKKAAEDINLIAYYRTACVELAKRCLKEEAVAAKSREEALEEAAKYHDAEAARMRRIWKDGDHSVNEDIMRHDLFASRIRALKSSRTDSGQSPATMPDAPHGDDK